MVWYGMLGIAGSGYRVERGRAEQRRVVLNERTNERTELDPVGSIVLHSLTQADI